MRTITAGLLRPSRLLASVACLLLVGISVAASSAQLGARTLGGATTPTSVIIRAEAGALLNLEHSTVLAGGKIGRQLPIIGGFSAQVPADRLAVLSSLPGVVSLVSDSTAQFHSSYDATGDPFSMLNMATAVGATGAWDNQVTGAGVDVAVLDSGVTPVAGLSGAGKIINGPDLSFDSQTPSVQYLDGYGHGTFMAGVIAGKDAGADPQNRGTAYLGIAPDARIVNVKVGAANGAVDVSQIIAGIDWVVQHRRDNGMNIRVLNLSLGTDSAQDYRIDPLAFAAEQAWRAGIVVVVAAGNDGAGSGRLNDPAIDPYLIAVGAAGTDAGLNAVASFSSFGNGSRKPDLVAPGVHMQGLRVPGSYIDQNFSSAAFGDRFFRGSGTSEAAAVTSGLAALILQKRPSLNNNQVKAILRANAKQLALQSPLAQGAGLAQLGNAIGDLLSLPSSYQNYSPAAGIGSLEAARGGTHVSLNGVDLTGEQDIFGHAWDPVAMAVATATRSSWNGGDWNGTTWSGTTWSGTTWSGTTWSGTTWSGTTWSGTTWTGTTWTGTTWSGTTWSGTTWTGTTWSGDTWCAGAWS